MALNYISDYDEVRDVLKISFKGRNREMFGSSRDVNNLTIFYDSKGNITSIDVYGWEKGK